MDEYERKTINEFEELRYNYVRDVEQLEGLYSRLKGRCSKLSEIRGDKHIDILLDLTVDSIRNIEEALHKLHEAGGETEKLIQLLQAYSEVTF